MCCVKILASSYYLFTYFYYVFLDPGRCCQNWDEVACTVEIKQSVLDVTPRQTLCLTTTDSLFVKTYLAINLLWILILMFSAKLKCKSVKM